MMAAFERNTSQALFRLARACAVPEEIAELLTLAFAAEARAQSFEMSVALASCPLLVRAYLIDQTGLADVLKNSWVTDSRTLVPAEAVLLARIHIAAARAMACLDRKLASALFDLAASLLTVGNPIALHEFLMVERSLARSIATVHFYQAMRGSGSRRANMRRGVDFAGASAACELLAAHYRWEYCGEAYGAH